MDNYYPIDAPYLTYINMDNYYSIDAPFFKKLIDEINKNIPKDKHLRHMAIYIILYNEYIKYCKKEKNMKGAQIFIDWTLVNFIISIDTFIIKPDLYSKFYFCILTKNLKVFFDDFYNFSQPIIDKAWDEIPLIEHIK